VGGVAPAIRKTPRQLAFDIARRRYFEARDIAEPESDDEFDFESLAAAALSVPAATKEGRFLGDELPRIFDRKGSSLLLRRSLTQTPTSPAKTSVAMLIRQT
jgi:hypothetical protein